MRSFDARGTSLTFAWLTNGVLLLCMVIVLFPFLYVIMTSFASEQEILTRGFFLFPHHWSFDAYRYLMHSGNFVTSFKNAIIITVVGTFINMVLTSLMAYGLSKRWLAGRSIVNFMVLFTMLFGGGIIPTYLVVKSLHLLNSYWALYLSGAIAPFHLIVMRSFFQAIPIELEESARIDGCSEMKLFYRIVLPLSLPAIATFTLFYAVQNWNSYFNAILYLNDSGKWPLQVYLRQLLNQSDGTVASVDALKFTPAVRMAAVVLTAVPLLLVYPFLQKYFNRGMLMGSVKG